jgi:hypothetical protein
MPTATKKPARKVAGRVIAPKKVAAKRKTAKQHALFSILGNKRGVIALVLLIVGAAMFGAWSHVGRWAFAAESFAAPVGVRAYVGGDSIALLWNPATGTTPKNYEVYRNSVKLATLAPAKDNVGGTVQRYIDRSAVPGTAYNYQVTAISTTNVKSGLTTAISTTLPTTTTPVPVITISSETPTDLMPVMINGKALLEAWYPKFSALLASEAAPAPTAFTMVAKPTCGAGCVINNTIEVDPGWARDALTKPSHSDLFIHEGVHIMQPYRGAPGWVVEGMADWVKYYIYGSNTTTNPTTYTYLNGYERAGYFFNWIAATYKLPNFTRDLHQISSTGFSYDFFKQQTGKDVGQLWTQMTGRRVSSPIALTNGASKTCADILNYDTTNGNTVQLSPCVGNSAQQWVWVANTATSAEGSIRGLNKCLHVNSGSKTDGARVFIWDCSATAAQYWIPRDDGTLMNPNSGKCLQPKGGAITTGTGMEIRTCGTGTIQKWGVQPFSQIKNVAAARCIDVKGSATANGTVVQLYGCNGTAAQQWKFVETAVRSTEGTFQALGKCLDVNQSGKTDGTKVQLWTCNNGAAQKWVKQSDGSFKNPNAAKCLQPKGSVLTASTPLEIRTCASTSTAQKWAPPLL